MKKNQFKADLKRALAVGKPGQWCLKCALDLSDRIHQAEANGYDVSSEEDRLWLQLTDKIEVEREMKRKHAR